jgi:hypothetical protein
LVFYKILIYRYEDGKYSMRQGSIDFIEPDTAGRYKREVFDITDTDVGNLLELIKKTAQDMYSFSFWDTNCDDKVCKFCSLRRLMN